MTRVAGVVALVAVPLGVAFAGPAVLGYGWARLLAAALALVAAVIAASRAAAP